MPDIPNRDELEARLASAISREQAAELNKLMDLLGDPPDLNNVPASFWENGGKALRGAIAPILQDVFTNQAKVLIDQLTIGVDWALVNQAAITWASQYTFDLVKGINETTMRGLQTAISTYYHDSLTLGELRGMISGYFGPMRAEMIATTEITRASVEGELGTVQQIERDNQSVKMIASWNTNNDERVCPVCKPLNQRKASGYEKKRPYWIHPTNRLRYGPPPTHPRDRCWVNWAMTVT